MDKPIKLCILYYDPKVKLYPPKNGSGTLGYPPNLNKIEFILVKTGRYNLSLPTIYVLMKYMISEAKKKRSTLTSQLKMKPARYMVK